MDLLYFREKVFLIKDFCYILPILIIFIKPKLRFNTWLWFYLYFSLYFLVNIASDIQVLYFQKSNLYYGYFYSIIDLILFIFLTKILAQNKKHKKLLILFASLSCLIFFIDLFFITGFNNQENAVSESIISLLLSMVIIDALILYFRDKLIVEKFKGGESIILLAFTFIYVNKLFYSFLNGFLYDSQSNYYLLCQIDNLVNLFIIFSVFISCYFIYFVKKRTYNA
jgi:hypothetical protein